MERKNIIIICNNLKKNTGKTRKIKENQASDENIFRVFRVFVTIYDCPY